jgi:hypothetical protein
MITYLRASISTAVSGVIQTELASWASTILSRDDIGLLEVLRANRRVIFDQT